MIKEPIVTFGIEEEAIMSLAIFDRKGMKL
jgi:hypothetical protein